MEVLTKATPMGDAILRITQYDHVYVEIKNATINRVGYNITAHYYLKNGKWDIPSFQDLYVKRNDWKETSNSARDKAKLALNAMMHVSFNPKDPITQEILFKAEAVYLETQCNNVRERLGRIKAFTSELEHHLIDMCYRNAKLVGGEVTFDELCTWDHKIVETPKYFGS